MVALHRLTVHELRAYRQESMPRVEDMTGFVSGPCNHRVVFLSAGEQHVVCGACGKMWEAVDKRLKYSELDLKLQGQPGQTVTKSDKE